MRRATAASVSARLFQLTPQPPLQHGEDARLVRRLQRAPLGDAVPLGETAAAAGGGRVLGDEHGMPAVGRLLAVVARIGGGASRSSMKSRACASTAGSPRACRYARSCPPSLNRRRKLERASLANTASRSSMPGSMPAPMPRPGEKYRDRHPGNSTRTRRMGYARSAERALATTGKDDPYGPYRFRRHGCRHLKAA